MAIVQMDDVDQLGKRTVVCLGFFDGVHIGHVSLVNKACEIKKEKGISACAHTFDVAPAQRLFPDRCIKELTPLPEKAHLLEKLGIDIVAVSKFDDEMMNLTGKDFLHDIIIKKLNAVHIIAGFHHVFGYHGDTNAEKLIVLCGKLGIGIDIMPPVTLDSGEVISSSMIRKALDKGDIIKAEEMLGRPCNKRLLSAFGFENA